MHLRTWTRNRLVVIEVHFTALVSRTMLGLDIKSQIASSSWLSPKIDVYQGNIAIQYIFTYPRTDKHLAVASKKRRLLSLRNFSSTCTSKIPFLMRVTQESWQKMSWSMGSSGMHRHVSWCVMQRPLMLTFDFLSDTDLASGMRLMLLVIAIQVGFCYCRLHTRPQRAL